MAPISTAAMASHSMREGASILHACDRSVSEQGRFASENGRWFPHGPVATPMVRTCSRIRLLTLGAPASPRSSFSCGRRELRPEAG
jgi:hypothetical protein